MFTTSRFFLVSLLLTRKSTLVDFELFHIHLFPTQQTLYTSGGQTFSTEGHIENFNATGGRIYYICLLQLQFTFQNNIN